MAEQTMSNGEVDLCIDDKVRVAVIQVDEQIEGEDHGAIGGVFEWDDAEGVAGGGLLHGGKDVFDGDLRCELVGLGVGKDGEGGLEGMSVGGEDGIALFWFED
jgi:hypothetical protein